MPDRLNCFVYAVVLHRREKRGHEVYDCPDENLLQLFSSYYRSSGVDSFSVTGYFANPG